MKDYKSQSKSYRKKRTMLIQILSTCICMLLLVLGATGKEEKRKFKSEKELVRQIKKDLSYLNDLQ